MNATADIYRIFALDLEAGKGTCSGPLSYEEFDEVLTSKRDKDVYEAKVAAAEGKA